MCSCIAEYCVFLQGLKSGRSMGTVWPLYLFSFVFVVVLSNIVFSRKVWNLEGAMGTVWPLYLFSFGFVVVLQNIMYLCKV